MEYVPTGGFSKQGKFQLVPPNSITNDSNNNFQIFGANYLTTSRNTCVCVMCACVCVCVYVFVGVYVPDSKEPNNNFYNTYLQSNMICNPFVLGLLILLLNRASNA